MFLSESIYICCRENIILLPNTAFIDENMTQKIVTRFAPSPTGFLHIGGARTALFNWLFARHNGGKALLRIEDTDKERSTQAAIDAILDGLKWFGLDWDDTPVFQSERAARHQEVAQALLDKGKAYKCFATPQELEAMRAEQRANKKPLLYDGRWRDRDPLEAPDGAPYVVRLKTETRGEMVINDAVQGKVTWRNEELDDYILLRSDGTPTYMLAVVVDDHDMGVTHIIRGDDHLNNAFRQLALIQAMGWEEPVYAHVPLIHGNDGAKLSKRHGALGVEAYRDEMGILPEALFNYLLRLGWSHGDTEIISRDEAINLFSLQNIGKSPSRFDPKKLANMNGIYMREADDKRLAELIYPLLQQRHGNMLDDTRKATVLAALPQLKIRAKSVHDLVDGAAFLFKTRPLQMDEIAKEAIASAPVGILEKIYQNLSNIDDWTLENLEDCIKKAAEAEDIGFGKIAQPLRAALTGTNNSPSIYDVLKLLGRDEALARINEQM